VLGAAYLLWLYQRVMFGPVTNPANSSLPDLNLREYACLVPLVLAAFWIGIYPKPFFDYLNPPSKKVVEIVNPAYFSLERADADVQRPEPAEPAAAAVPVDASESGPPPARPPQQAAHGAAQIGGQ
jgi:NADH-quinone oxidoreductase subunit M